MEVYGRGTDDLLLTFLMSLSIKLIEFDSNLRKEVQIVPFLIECSQA